MVNVDEIYDVEIEGIGDKGDGVAKIDGLAVIVQGSKKIGEQLQIKITNVRERFAFAEIVENSDQEEKVEEGQEEETSSDSEDFGDDPEEAE